MLPALPVLQAQDGTTAAPAQKARAVRARTAAHPGRPGPRAQARMADRLRMAAHAPITKTARPAKTAGPHIAARGPRAVHARHTAAQGRMGVHVLRTAASGRMVALVPNSAAPAQTVPAAQAPGAQAARAKWAQEAPPQAAPPGPVPRVAALQQPAVQMLKKPTPPRMKEKPNGAEASRPAPPKKIKKIRIAKKTAKAWIGEAAQESPPMLKRLCPQ